MRAKGLTVRERRILTDYLDTVVTQMGIALKALETGKMPEWAVKSGIESPEAWLANLHKALRGQIDDHGMR